MELWNTNMFAGVAILVCLAAVYVQGEDKPAVAILGKSHTFKCNLSPGDDGIVWLDNVYNMEANKPATIFQGQDNADRNVNSDHPIHDRLSVDASNSLTISALAEDDAGLYFCQTTGADGQVQQERYSLTLGGAPACEGETEDRRVGDQVMLSCSMSFSGSETPVLEWFAGDNMIESDDAYTIMLARKTVDLEVEPSMDKVEYKCRATFGDVMEECGFTMEVKYATRDLVILPQEEITVGQDVTCSAKGNPAPTVTLTKPDNTKSTGENEVKFTVLEEMRGTDIEFTCKAENTLDGSGHMQQTSAIITVVDERPKEEPEPENEVTDTNGDEHNNAHPEEGEIKDEEAEPSGGDGNGSAGPEKAGVSSTGIIAGIIVATIVLVLIITIVVCIKKRQAKQPPKGSKKVPTKKKKVPTATLR